MSKRSFSGCWTCRSRKVKCDLAKPYCERCQKAGIECAGYALMLGWATPLTLTNQRQEQDSSTPFQRRTVELGHFDNFLTNEELLTTISELDNGTTDLKIGPFSRYQIHENPAKQSSAVPKELDIFQEKNDSDKELVHPQLIEAAKLTIYALKGLDFTIDSQNMFHILYPNFFPQETVVDFEATTKIVERLYERKGGSVILKSALLESVSKLNSQIFTFFRSRSSRTGCELLVIDRIKSIIIECLSSKAKVSYQLDESQDWAARDLLDNVKLAIFYCAFGLQQFEYSSDLEESLELSIELRKLSIYMLNFHLDEYDSNRLLFDEDDYEYEINFILCLILQFQLDSYFSIFENLNILFAIGEYVIISKFQDRQLPDVAKFLIHIFAVIKLFYESTQVVSPDNYSISENDQNKYLRRSDQLELRTPKSEASITAIFLEDDEEIKKPLIVTLSSITQRNLSCTPSQEILESYSSDLDNVCLGFGLPRSLLGIFREIVHLTNHRSIFRSQQLLPRTFLQISAEVENRLLEWQFGQHYRLTNEDGTYILPYHSWLDQHVKCFYNALKVYFYTLVRGSPVSRFRNFVETSLDHLDNIVKSSFGSEHQIWPLVWPLLVCGSASSNRDRVLRLWNLKSFSKLNNWRAKQVTLEVWNRTDEGETLIWFDLVKEWDISLCLV